MIVWLGTYSSKTYGQFQTLEKVEVDRQSAEKIVNDLLEKGVIQPSEAETVRKELFKIKPKRWQKTNKQIKKVIRTISSYDENLVKEKIVLPNNYKNSYPGQFNTKDISKAEKEALEDAAKNLESIFGE